MKRKLLFIFMIGLLSLLVLNGCNTEQGNVSEKLENPETALNENKDESRQFIKLSSIKDTGMMKSIGVDEYYAYNYKSEFPHQLELWVEKYENGILKEKILELKQSVKADSDITISLSIINFPSDTIKTSKWTIGIQDDDGSSSISVEHVVPIHEMGSSSQADTIEINDHNSHPLALVLMSKGNELRTYSGLEDESSLKENLKEDYAYLFLGKLVGKQ